MGIGMNKINHLRLTALFCATFGVMLAGELRADDAVIVSQNYTIIGAEKIKHPKEKKWISQCKKSYKKYLKKQKIKKWLKQFNQTKNAYCTEYDYTLRATAHNSSTETALGVKGVVSSINPAVAILEGNIDFGDIGPGLESSPDDSFNVRSNGLIHIETAPLNWQVTYSRPQPQNMTAKERVQALEAQGALPKLDRSLDIQGPDTNTNGIRDDVENLIATNYTSAPQRAAAEQFARVMQSAILVEKTDTAAAKAIAVKGSKAINCIYSKFDGSPGSKQPAAVVAELKSISTNTKPRLLAYMAYAKALDGTTGALPEGDTCE
jgi:hypothetical protein